MHGGPETLSLRASHHRLSLWTGSRGDLGGGRFRSLGYAALGNGPRLLLSPAQAKRQGGGSVPADEFSLLPSGGPGAVRHGQESLGDRESGLQRSQEPSR